MTVIGVLLLIATPWFAALVAGLDSRAATVLLGPNRAKELARRVEDLAESRADILDAADLERRRIERDLHDGAQQRLVSLAMNLGIARATLTDLPPEARAVIDEAHREAKEAIEELSNLVRGLHPAVLEDRGLDAAISGIAARAPFPVELTVELAERPTPTVEAVAYFVVSETLANVAKHARATRCSVHVRRRAQLLTITVGDNGVGGADPAGRHRTAGPAQTRRVGRRNHPDQQPPRGPYRHHRGAAVRAVIAEDSVLLRIGLVKVLEMAGFEVAAEAGDAESLLRAVEEHRPDLALVDVRMPPGFTDEGVRAALMIRQQCAGNRRVAALAVRRGAVRRRPARHPERRHRLPAQATGRRRRGVRRRPQSASRPAAPRSTRRSSPSSCCAEAADPTRWNASPRANAKSSR